MKNHLLRIADSEGIKITDSAALTLAKHAQGGMRDAISLLDLCAGNRTLIDDDLVSDVIGVGGRDEMINLLRAIADRDYDAIFGTVEETARSSRDIAVFWQELISIYRDLLIVKNSKEPLNYLDLTDTESEALVEISKQFSFEMLVYHSQMIADAYLTMMRSNALKRIIAELTLIRMCDVKLSSSPEAMLARISALEKAQASGAVTTQVVKTETNAEIKADEPTARAIKRPTVRQESDDDMFRGDAPTDVSTKPRMVQEKNTPVKSSVAVRQLKAFKGRAEATEIMDRRDPMLSSFFKRAKWYSDSEGNIVLKFENKYEIENLKRFNGEKFFLEIVSQATGVQMSVSQVSYECENEKKSDEIIDKIIEASKNA